MYQHKSWQGVNIVVALSIQATNQETTEHFWSVQFTHPVSSDTNFEDGYCYEDLSTSDDERQVGLCVLAMPSILDILSLELRAQQMVEDQTR